MRFGSDVLFATEINSSSEAPINHNGSVSHNFFNNTSQYDIGTGYHPISEFYICSEIYEDDSQTYGYNSEMYVYLKDVNTGGKDVNILKYLLPFNSHDLEDPTSKQMLVNQNGEYKWQKMVASDEDFKAYLGIQ